MSAGAAQKKMFRHDSQKIPYRVTQVKTIKVKYGTISHHRRHIIAADFCWRSTQALLRLAGNDAMLGWQ